MLPDEGKTKEQLINELAKMCQQVAGLEALESERKRAEEALKDSEERYKSLLTNVKLGVFRSTPGRTGRFLEVNPAMEEITSYSRKELLKMNVSDLYLHPEEREAILEEVASATGKTTRELLFRKKDGTEIAVSDTKVAVRDDAGKILYFDGIIEDITERKLAEEREKELQQELYLSRRLVAIGELAAGVAHEINNPLTGILGFSQRLLRKSTDEEVSQDLLMIHDEAQRVAKVVENLLTFARRRESRKQYADINDILQKALELRAYELKTSDIEVVLDLAPSLPKTMADFHQIQEVFLNIILNAEQAMSEANGGGKLSIKAQPVRDYIKISFADDGPGIPAEQLDKVFDPFFTTRQERGGTGLGLSVCHGIVAEHGGKIYAKSKLGKGATFFVELPLTTEEVGG
jgi:two-component system NtrC family sensor kinase